MVVISSVFIKINLTRVNSKVYHLRQLVQYSKNMKTEVELMWQNKKLMRFLERRAKQTKMIPLDEVKAQLGIK